MDPKQDDKPQSDETQPDSLPKGVVFTETDDYTSAPAAGPAPGLNTGLSEGEIEEAMRESAVDQPRQTVVMGLHGPDKTEEEKKQVLVTGVQQTAAKTRIPTYTPASQYAMKKETHSYLKVILPLLAVIALILAAGWFFIFKSYLSSQ